MQLFLHLRRTIYLRSEKVKHIRAEEVLPQALLEEIQKHIKGQYIYIPENPGERRGWGERTGAKETLRKRNKEIREKFKNGYKITQLAESYYLSMASIKKIVYEQK